MRRALCTTIVLLLACSEAEPDPAECVAELDHVFAPGTRWGPCDEGTCTDGSTCYPQGRATDICSAYTCEQQHPWCGETVVSTSPADAAFPCQLDCTSDFQCPEGAVCGFFGCVWPYFECTTHDDCPEGTLCRDFEGGGWGGRACE